MGDTETCYLTVVRTQGILFLRPEKVWRPIVSVTLVENGLTHETVLGIDGQNPNLKNPSVLRDVTHGSRIDIRVWHKPNNKNRKKRHMIGSAYVTLGDLARRQDRPGADIIVHLKCPPPQKRSPAIGGARNMNCATLTIRLRLPSPSPPDSCLSLKPLSSSHTLNDTDTFSDNGSSGSSLPSSPVKNHVEVPWEKQATELCDVLPPKNGSVLRRRAYRRSTEIRGYSINTTDDEFERHGSDSEASTNSYCQESSSQTQVSSDHPADYFSLPAWTPVSDDSQEVIKIPCCTDSSVDGDTYIAMRILPRYAGQGSLPVDPQEAQLSLIEAILNTFSPYCEMSTPDCDFNRVLGRLLTEWYAVGASLLAAAGLNAAVFGFSSGTLFEVDGPAMRSVAIGSISAGIGLVCDAWFLVMYSGADVTKFQRVALDVYGTYVFFCLTCRLPTFCLFISSCALMVFLLTVAWSAWPTAVLVMCCAAGVLVTLQYLIYGCHRAVNFVIWSVLRIWRGSANLFRGTPLRNKISVPPVSMPNDSKDPEVVGAA